MKNIMTGAALEMFLYEQFPQVAGDFKIVETAGNKTTVAMNINDAHLRPGGTVSGPTLFLLADVTFYLGLLAVIGPVALAVTTNANINFMRKPDPSGLVAVANLMKCGKQLAVGEVTIYSASDLNMASPVAHATMTYAIPPLGDVT
ncbi:MAG: PaaI family thioesterase [Candidatus Puniceispirillales bacterium WSBS_2018_MAG_OTU23]